MTSTGRASGLEPLGLAVDSHAEEALYHRNAGRVFGFCLSRLRRREDAEDAVQTTFLHAFRSLRRGVVPLVESAWLLGIARNVCLERWEAAGKRGRVETSWDPAELDRAAPAPNERPDELLDLEEALTRLPAQQRRAVVLRDWRGLSYEEIAAELGVSHAAVETMIFRGRNALATALREGARPAGRRKLASLGNVGSLLAAAKGFFGGGAAATKLAAAATVVAVSGAGLVVGESVVRGGGSEPARPASTQRVETPAAVPAQVRAQGPVASVPTSVTSASAARRAGASAPTGVHRAPPDRGSATSAQQPSTAEAPSSAAPASAAPVQPTTSSAPKAPLAKAGETVKKVAPKALADPLTQAVASTPAAPVAGAAENAAAPVVDAVTAVAEPVVAGAAAAIPDPPVPDPPLPDPPAVPQLP